MQIIQLQSYLDVKPEWGEPRRYINRAGYVNLRWRTPTHYAEMREHRFITKVMPNEHVHHKNGVKHDNRLENLDVVSPSEHGRIHKPRGYTKEELFDLYVNQGLSTTECGKRLGLNAGTISRALAHYGIQAKPRRSYLVPVDHEMIIRLAARGYRQRAIAKIMGIGRSLVKRVYRDKQIPPSKTGRPKNGSIDHELSQ